MGNIISITHGKKRKKANVVKNISNPYEIINSIGEIRDIANNLPSEESREKFSKLCDYATLNYIGSLSYDVELEDF